MCRWKEPTICIQRFSAIKTLRQRCCEFDRMQSFCHLCTTEIQLPYSAASVVHNNYVDRHLPHCTLPSSNVPFSNRKFRCFRRELRLNSTKARSCDSLVTADRYYREEVCDYFWKCWMLLVVHGPRTLTLFRTENWHSLLRWPCCIRLARMTTSDCSVYLKPR
jgi:hypothetical protein